MKTYNSVLVAKYMFAIACNHKTILNVTKVQKLLYILYGNFLAKFDIRIVDESPKAWPYGPVFPKTRENIDYNKLLDLSDPEFYEISKDEVLTKALHTLVNRFADLSASKLTDWSHSEDSPWDKTTKHDKFKWNDPIPDEYIKEYFSQFNSIIQ